jgi:hypothetical protein
MVFLFSRKTKKNVQSYQKRSHYGEAIQPSGKEMDRK